VGSWALVLLFAAAALLCRRRGDSWPVTVAKLAALTAVSVVAAALLGSMMARWL